MSHGHLMTAKKKKERKMEHLYAKGKVSLSESVRISMHE